MSKRISQYNFNTNSKFINFKFHDFIYHVSINCVDIMGILLPMTMKH